MDFGTYLREGINDNNKELKILKRRKNEIEKIIRNLTRTVQTNADTITRRIRELNTKLVEGIGNERSVSNCISKNNACQERDCDSDRELGNALLALQRELQKIERREEALEQDNSRKQQQMNTYNSSTGAGGGGGGGGR